VQAAPSGDHNSLRADPKATQAVGFPRPILYGFCSLGMADLKNLGRSPSGTAWAMQLRFSPRPLSGLTLCVEIWRDGLVSHLRRGAVLSSSTADGEARLVRPGLKRQFSDRTVSLRRTEPMV
jgi:MaoC like domain